MQCCVSFSPAWKWDDNRKVLVAKLTGKQSAELVIFTKPVEKAFRINPGSFRHRDRCIDQWRQLLADGTSIVTPEPIVQDAWRSIVVGNFMIAVGDRMHYSAGNAYDHLYEAECGDAVRSLMLFGHAADARKMLGPLLDFDRQATRFHVAGHKLQLLAHYYWVTRDKESLRETSSRWEPVDSFIRESRKTDNGLLPKDSYAGDINKQVYSLNSNADCWRGLRDMAAVLGDLGEKDRGRRAARRRPAQFRKAILDAVTKSERRDRRTFIPVALLAGEKPHDPLTATRTGQLLRPHHPLRARLRRVRPRRRARGVDHRLPAQPRRARDGDDPQHAAPGRVQQRAGRERALRAALQPHPAAPRRPRPRAGRLLRPARPGDDARTRSSAARGRGSCTATSSAGRSTCRPTAPATRRS